METTNLLVKVVVFAWYIGNTNSEIKKNLERLEMKFVSKYFDELTTSELYEILKARAEIFVVEQNCVYRFG